MSATAYNGSNIYFPYTVKDGDCGGDCGCGGKKKHHDHPKGCGCEECKCGCKDKGCGCEDKECGCCPPGLVSVFGPDGKHAGCLTPNDAELFMKNSSECDNGYAKLFNNSTGQFLGCVSETQFAALYATVNPS